MSAIHEYAMKHYKTITLTLKKNVCIQIDESILKSTKIHKHLKIKNMAQKKIISAIFDSSIETKKHCKKKIMFWVVNCI